MTTQSEREQIDQARAVARAETIAELRRFTGIPGYTPELGDPEHVSYADYELQLEHGLSVWSANFDSAVESVTRATAIRDGARKRMDDEQQRRIDERAGANRISRLVGAAKDVTFPEKRDHAQRERELEEKWEYQHRCENRVREIRAELAEVSAWLELMFTTAATAQAARQQRRVDEEVRQEQAARDVSSRRFATFTRDEFAEQDQRRVARVERGHLTLEGSVLGTGWRQDSTDDSSGNSVKGNWSLVWNHLTNETTVELAAYRHEPMVWLLGTKITSVQQFQDVFNPLQGRMTERNSLALVLDAYEAL
ncbi:hypothetical protein LQK89_17675 (plasmid) [Curtobacterium sp. C1]|uniref:hypothetical protein n=1 Tax=Curtobacterium sp. C1 TaxID=2898151 RepID=UPI001E2CA3C1|nr:hypothetical protein [Curtobacterium sp. C1]UFU16051.1 hypothetical protein LQK89_17675 [Curtobacterium sp. C1]